MSNRYESAFNLVLNLQGVLYTIKNVNTGLEVDVKIAPSNYFRKLSSIEETVIEGKEFVISKKFLDDAGFGVPKRGYRLTKKSDLSDINIIGEVKEMVILGSVVGYRVRTE